MTAYLKEALDAEKRYDIEAHLLDCPLCSEALEGYCKHHLLEVLDLKTEATQHMPTQETLIPTVKKTQPKKPLFNLNRIAATFLLVFGCSAGYQYWNHQAEMQRQYQLTEDFRYMENTLRSEIEKREGLLGNAIAQYQNNEFELAIKNLTELQEAQDDNPEIAYYLGMAYAKNKQPTHATHWLSIARINHPKKYEQASWQLVLAHLDANQKAAAISILQDLVSLEESVFHEDAVALLNELQE